MEVINTEISGMQKNLLNGLCLSGPPAKPHSHQEPLVNLAPDSLLHASKSLPMPNDVMPANQPMA